MTPELQKEVVEVLFYKNKKLFFNEPGASIEENNKGNPFIVHIEGWEEKKQAHVIEYYELKDEFKESLQKLSLAEILQILKINDNSDVKTIKRWVAFIGWIVLISVIISVVYGLVIAL